MPTHATSREKPLLALDFDDVLVDVTRHFLAYYQKHCGRSIDYEAIENELAPLLGVSREEELILWDSFFASEEYLSIAPTKEDVTALEKLGKAFDLVILTNRTDRYRQSLMKWIDRHLAGRFSKIVFSYDFNDKQESKGLICAQLGIALLVDDEPENILSCIKHGIAVLVYDCPWNKKLLGDIPRIGSLKEIAAYAMKSVLE